ncbi:MAG: YkgJ family cysteine cluster protein [Tepidisphaeraceae bacterium]
MRLRLAILGESPCGQCYAACCRQNGHAYAALLEEDEARRFGPFSVAARIDNGTCVVVERVLPYRDGRCVFLGEDDRCTVYEDRPRACRAFQCVNAYNREGVGRHGEFLARNPLVLAMLESL